MLRTFGLLAVLLGNSWAQTLFKDEAFKENTTGSSVVDSVLDILGSTCLINNEVFLRRWAHVDSSDGTAARTYADPFSGGIWQIDEGSFNMTKNNVYLQQAYNVIKSKLNIDWSKVTYNDLRKPINSGVAAVLLIKAKNLKVIPESLELQATLWSGVLRPGQMAFNFVLKARGMDTDCRSDKMLDLAALKYQVGPTFVGDSLRVAREQVFKNTTGARPGASKVALLLMDELRDTTFAKSEAQKLKESGIKLIVLRVSNDTANHDIERIVSPPTCYNARTVSSFGDLTSVVERLTSDICRAPLVLTPSDFEFPCNVTINARLPDTSDAIITMVTPDNGDIDVYASKSFTHPDGNAYDAHVTSQHSLYVRGTDPMYIRVTGQGSTCTGNYHLHVKETDEFRDFGGVCIIAGTVRTCTPQEMNQATHDVILVPDPNAPFLCDTRNHSVEYYPYPTDFHKFIMCDQLDRTFVGLCPVGVQSCKHSTNGCKYTNPCTQEEILAGNMRQMDQCGDKSAYVTCTSLGLAEVMKCPPLRVWNHDTRHCVFEYVHDPSGIGASSNDATIANPCLHSHSDHQYFPYPGHMDKYIFCDQYGNAFAGTCRSGIWSEQSKICTDIVAVG
ncbi:uncharacterized protein LOC128223356 [Mya arenaria]|uniref:uncharacterized protein LOC128223356 n=1 Tax=Mya arenaria TaxID=6604 RepID=UPI0022DF0D02|nr:uncharacterized protein LOC128223356 [Mya arenaria]